MASESRIFVLLQQFRAALIKQDEAALNSIIQAYRLVFDRLGGRIDALIQVAGGIEGLTGAKLIRLNQYKALEDQLLEELKRFSVLLDSRVTTAAREALIAGDYDSVTMLKYLVGNRTIISANFSRLPLESIQSMIGFLQPDSPLYQSINALAGFNTDRVMRGLVEGISLGDSPRLIGDKLADAFTTELGKGLTDSLRIARTAQLYAYREASRANYVMNNDVVSGWVWAANVGGDPEPCLSCLAMNGEEFDLDENLDDHDNGRCAQIPMVAGVNPIENMQSGEDYFKSLPEDTQLEMMGEKRYNAWKDGDISFSDMSKQTDHGVWGHVRVPTTLADLFGSGEEE